MIRTAGDLPFISFPPSAIDAPTPSEEFLELLTSAILNESESDELNVASGDGAAHICLRLFFCLNVVALVSAVVVTVVISSPILLIWGFGVWIVEQAFSTIEKIPIRNKFLLFVIVKSFKLLFKNCFDFVLIL